MSKKPFYEICALVKNNLNAYLCKNNIMLKVYHVMFVKQNRYCTIRIFCLSSKNSLDKHEWTNRIIYTMGTDEYN